MKKKSIGMNAVLNMIRTLCRVIFPLITFPYISRILHVDNIGVYNFCASIISYFTLTANLGIDTYSVREGSRFRDDKIRMNQFASEIFSINLIATIISYVVLFSCIVTLPRLRADASILIALSISIILTTVGCEWIFTIYEDFMYITIRSILFQLIALIMMFALVKTADDLLKYAFISTLSSAGSNIINVFFVKKYCKIKFVVNKNMLKRLRPILFLFANSIATTIYTNSDITMLGIISGNRSTGLYSVSTKIYDIVKQLLAAIIIVSIPRLSSFLGKKDYDNFDELANKILNSLIAIVAPAMVGIFGLSKNIILIISGYEYIDAASSLQILAVALLFSVFSWFYTSCILIPYREEQRVLKATIIAAVSNIILNFVVIPIWKQNGAAFTTVVAEFLSLFICMSFSKKYFKAKLVSKDILSVVGGCACIYCICFLCEKYISSVFFSTIIAMLISIFVYFGILILSKNKAVEFIIETVRSR